MRGGARRGGPPADRAAGRPQADVDAILGERVSSYAAFAADADVHAEAASGGVVSALLAHLLQTGAADGALVCATEVVRDPCGKRLVRPRFAIATTRADVLAARGSTYVATEFAAEALPLIDGFRGRIAVVGLPCDVSLLRRRAASDPSLAGRLALAVSLACGHNSAAALVDATVERLEASAGAQVSGFRFRAGPRRDLLRATLEDGRVVELPASDFSLYQALYFFADRKCLQCGDHFGYDADISVADLPAEEAALAAAATAAADGGAPSPEAAPLPSGVHANAVLVRTQAGEAAFSSAVTSGAIRSTPIAAEEILRTQSRTAPFHRNVSARAKAGRRLGVEIHDRTRLPVSARELLAARIVLANWRATRTDAGARRVLRIPRPLLRAYLRLLRALQGG